MQETLDLCTDFLLTTVDQATATGLSKVVDGAVSHDSVSRFLSKNSFTSKDSAVSQHILKMRDGGLISGRRAGQTIFYSLRAEHLPLLKPFFTIINSQKKETA